MSCFEGAGRGGTLLTAKSSGVYGAKSGNIKLINITTSSVSTPIVTDFSLNVNTLPFVSFVSTVDAYYNWSETAISASSTSLSGTDCCAPIIANVLYSEIVAGNFLNISGSAEGSFRIWKSSLDAF